MNESLMLKVALATAVLGLAVLMLIVKFSGLKEMSISEAKQLDEDQTVKITGTVERFTSKEGFSIIDVKKQESVSVVVFESINLSKGQRVEITGKTQEYQGKSEIVADKIVVK
jgi:uncharacterized protein YdeI (BOF family)